MADDHPIATSDDDDNKMITSIVDPVAWGKEVDRIKAILDKEIYPSSSPNKSISQNNIKKGTKSDIPKNLVDVTTIDEVLERVERISGYYKTVKEFILGEGKSKLASLIDYWDQANSQISNYEK